MGDSFLSQEEIDALLNQKDEISGENANDQNYQHLTPEERDALGEIGNISMGTAATTLSQLLNQKVLITTPRVDIQTPRELADKFQVPYIIIEVNFTEGLEGSNLLVMKLVDATVIADLMMGGDGTGVAQELSEIHASAVAEAMNQMIGSAATSMSTIFQKGVGISPPTVTAVDLENEEFVFPWEMDEPIAIVSFQMKIGELINSEFMQVIPLEIAKEEARLLLNPESSEEPVQPQEPAPQEVPAAEPDRVDSASSSLFKGEAHNLKNIDLILDVPLKVSVVLGKTKRPIKEVLNLTPGSIVELDRLADEPVDILVNGTLIARGEVVVIDENFGVRITSIISPLQRISQLGAR